jgi:hypothetical protein
MVRVAGGCTLILLAAMAMSPAFAAGTHQAAGHSSKVHLKRHSKHAHVVRGQREIDPTRASEIQTALIREHYLSGAPSGQWDSATEAAMQKYQADNGWQTRLTPDSRALIKLGLGPNGTSGMDAAKAVQQAPETSPAGTPADAEPGTLASVHAVSN